MICRALFAALLALAIATPAFSQRTPARRSAVSAAVPAPNDRARQWLTLLDDKNYTQSWTEAGTAFKAAHKADAWTGDAGAKRTPLGAMASRDLKSIDLSRSNIAVVRYDSVFAHKSAAVETVTLAFDKGTWSVSDYAIN